MMRCNVCGEGSITEENLIRSCINCKASVHDSCAGTGAHHSLCRLCFATSLGLVSEQVVAERKCQLCPNIGGYLVELDQSDYKYWAHLVCGIWVPELWFGNRAELRPICGVEPTKILQDRFKLKCIVCKRRNAGACIQCSSKKCLAAAHVTCAMGSGLYLGYSTLDNSKVRPEFYCQQHQPSAPIDAPQSLGSIGLYLGPERNSLDELKNGFKQIVNLPETPVREIKKYYERKSNDENELIHTKHTLSSSSRRARPKLNRRISSSSSMTDTSFKRRRAETISPLNLPIGAAQPYRHIRDVVETVTKTCFQHMDLLRAKQILKSACEINQLPVFAIAEPFGLPDLRGYAGSDFLVTSSAGQFECLFNQSPDLYFRRKEYSIVTGLPTYGDNVQLDDLQKSAFGLQILNLKQRDEIVATLIWNVLHNLKHRTGSKACKHIIYIPLLIGKDIHHVSQLLYIFLNELKRIGQEFILNPIQVDLPAGVDSLLIFLKISSDQRFGLKRALGSCFHVLQPSTPNLESHATLCVRLGDFDSSYFKRNNNNEYIDVMLRQTSDGFDVVETEQNLFSSFTPKFEFSSQELPAAIWASMTIPSDEELDVKQIEKDLLICRKNNSQLISKLLSRIAKVTSIEKRQNSEVERSLESYRQIVGSVIDKERAKEEHDLNALCSICHGGDSIHGNLIVICEGCELGYHEKCHIEKIDVSAPIWYCCKCSNSVKTTTPPKASLSPSRNTHHQNILMNIITP